MSDRYWSSFGRRWMTLEAIRVRLHQDGCEWAPRHLPVVTVSRPARRLFRRTCWVRCWECGLKLGPFGEMEARRLCAAMDRGVFDDP